MITLETPDCRLVPAIQTFSRVIFLQSKFAMQLRDYQLETIRQIDLCGSNKVLVHLPTGSGKSEIFAHLLARDGGTLIVRGRQLVENASKRLELRGVDHGVIMANHKKYDLNKSVQVCSIDTLRKRGYSINGNLLIDEAHFAVSESFRDIVANNPITKIIGFTATPYVNDSLEHIADTVIRPVSHRFLVDHRYLVPGIYYAPTELDLKGVKVTAGDYNLGDLDAALSPKIYGDAVAYYKKLLDGKPAVCFAINKRHAEIICARFSDAGYNAVTVTDKTPLDERAKYIAALESGTLHIVVNVNVFSVGVDIPCLQGVIVCRPTKSLNWHIQSLGRGTRPYPGKTNFIVIDHANNTREHGFIEDEPPPVKLDNRKPQRAVGTAVNICKSCFGAFRGAVCPHCATPVPAGAQKENKLESREISGELQQIITVDKSAAVRVDLKKWISIAKWKGFKRGWVYFQIKKKYGDSEAKKFWPVIASQLPHA